MYDAFGGQPANAVVNATLHMHNIIVDTVVISVLHLTQAKDELRNRRLCGGDTFEVRLEGPSSVEGSVEDHGDGTYTASYQVCVAGGYTLSVTNGESPAPQPNSPMETPFCEGIKIDDTLALHTMCESTFACLHRHTARSPTLRGWLCHAENSDMWRGSPFRSQLCWACLLCIIAWHAHQASASSAAPACRHV